MTEANRFFEQISMFVAQAIADLDGVDLAEVRASVPSGPPLLFSSVQSYFERQGWQHQLLPGKTALRFTYQGQCGKWVCLVSTREQARQLILIFALSAARHSGPARGDRRVSDPRQLQLDLG